MGTNMPDNLEEQVKKIVSEMTGLKSERIDPEAHLYNDLGVDSLKGIELAVAVQEKFGIRVSDSRISQINTVKLVVEEVKRLLAKKTESQK